MKEDKEDVVRLQGCGGFKSRCLSEVMGMGSLTKKCPCLIHLFVLTKIEGSRGHGS